jgi:nitrite reductase (NADH) small subunit
MTADAVNATAPADWLAVCGVDDIPELGSRKLAAGAWRIALIRTEGSSVFALEDRCPHKGGPLSEGIVAADRVACPLHGQCVELATGRMIAPDEGSTRRFDVRVDGGQVWLRRADLRAAPAAEPMACGACA